jgi:hypothetical protein
MKNSEAYELSNTYNPDTEHQVLQRGLVAEHEEITELLNDATDNKYYTHICCEFCDRCCICAGYNPNDVVDMDMDTEPYSYPDSYYKDFIQDEIEEADNLTALERASREGWITDEEIEALTAQDFINLINAEYDQAGPSLTELWDPAADGAWDGAAAA